MNKNTTILFTGAVLIFLVVIGYLIYSDKGVGGVNLRGVLNLPSVKKDVEVTESGNVASKQISLTVTSPTPGQVLTSSTLVVKGTTNPKAEVFVNDKETVADSNGNFSVTISLDEGENEIIVSANDSSGNVAERDIMVTVQTF